ncbi:Dabb family protein [Cytophaga sp. FL35]|uniref:Dabb family protein n=1 Tax=Cytophaga sp. FL35 TaxID=1904456 RepID=UPI00165375ED|nr:Dabb family protein [Cytophaga sp. FL35]MBC6999832.1 Dabb family protein [Cytophaga sp. FL35]
MTRHYGMFQFKEEITQAQVDNCFAVMKDMVGKIPGLLKMEHGQYDSTEGMNDGFTHGFIMTFDSPESREAYLPHPIHEEVKAFVVPKLERVVVFDFNV